MAIQIDAVEESFDIDAPRGAELRSRLLELRPGGAARRIGGKPRRDRSRAPRSQRPPRHRGVQPQHEALVERRLRAVAGVEE